MAVTTTLGSNILVIEIRWYPTVTAVTVVALRGGRQVIEVFTHGGDAIVTTVTGAQHLEMIDRYYWIP